MPNIATLLKEEIRRLARQEIKAVIGKLRKDNAMLKHTTADHKRRLAKLEKDGRQLLADALGRREESLAASDEEIRKARITSKMIRTIRRRLGLSQADFAKLLKVSPMTVLLWEHKKGRLGFRGKTKAAVIEVRKLTKSEARERLEESMGKAKGKAKGKRKGKKR